MGSIYTMSIYRTNQTNVGMYLIFCWFVLIVHVYHLTSVSLFQRSHKAKCVILAFDDYTHVPGAKGMTQAKRAKKNTEPFSFHEREQLPEMIPWNWDTVIMNRGFKKRVIQLVIRRLPTLLDLGFDEQLIIDYMGPPQLYNGNGDKMRLMDGFEEIGEADLKFFRYADLFENLLVMATDSDYLPIALLRLHTQYSVTKRPCIVLQRIRVSLPSDKKMPPKQDGERAKRVTEFVHVNRVLDTLLELMGRKTKSDEMKPHYIEMLCCLIAMFGGTDFTRGMPRVGPRRIWDSLAHIFPSLIKSFNGETGQLNPDVAVDELVSRVYSRIFATHLIHVSNRSNAKTILSSLSRSKLADSTKGQLPSHAFIGVTVRNTNWVLLYWSGKRVDEMSGDYGFRVTGNGNRLTYADT